MAAKKKLRYSSQPISLRLCCGSRCLVTKHTAAASGVSGKLCGLRRARQTETSGHPGKLYLVLEQATPSCTSEGGGNEAAFVGFSAASTNGYETAERPPDPTEWGSAQTFYRARLQDFTPLSSPIPLGEVFSKRDAELRAYYLSNRTAQEKERLFFVVQAGRLQCLNGAYLSQVSAELARLLLDEPMYSPQQSTHSLLRESDTGEQLRTLRTRVGQSEFSGRVRENYGMRFCFPDCDVAECAFLRGAHIARWADAPALRGDLSNGLCLCLMHDGAFEVGSFTVDLQYRVWVNPDRTTQSPWSTKHLLPCNGHQLRLGNVLPSKEALRNYWSRIDSRPP